MAWVLETGSTVFNSTWKRGNTIGMCQYLQGSSATQIHLREVQNRSHLVPSSNRIPRLFALVIGIDDYPNPYQLFGAVADAKAMRAYLKDDLQVPEGYIYFLTDDQATRDKIVKALQDFKNDQRIKNGDPIVIFFAGHGRELTAPPAWGVGNKIQSILPYDYRMAGPIPDRAIGTLIDDIAKEKGDNITLILDCCYSAGCARHPDRDYVSRTVELDFSIPIDLDHDIWNDRCSSLPDGFTHQGHRSHVLLSACKVNELAYERAGRGLFTSALLTILQSGAVHNLSYVQVLEGISIDKQNPQCIGTNRHRILFDHSVPPGGQVFYSAQVSEHGKLIISAGLAHGVAHGVEFSLYSDQKLRLGIAAVDGAATIDDFQTTITASEALTHASPSFAKLTCVGRVPLYLAPTTGNLHPILEETLRGMDGSGTNASNSKLVEKVEEAKLQVAMEGDLVIFDILDQRINKLGLRKLPYTISLERLPHVLRAAAHYYWYLDFTNRNRHGKAAVTVDFYQLKEASDYDDYGLSVLVPVKPGLCREDASSLVNPYLINFDVTPGAFYGLKITNKTPRDLYMNVFLFNNSSLSITPWYTQSNAGNPEPPLKRNGGTFVIGEGPGETIPLSFTFRNGQDIDVGYLKAFFATRPIDLSDIAQMSPFPEKTSHPLIKDSDDARDGDLAEGSPTRKVLSDIWFTVTIPVVQRRKI